MQKEANNINSESAELPESLLDASHTNSTNRRHWGSFSGVTGLNQSTSLNKSSGSQKCSGTVKQHFPHHKTTKHFCKCQQHTRPTSVIIWMTNAKPLALCCTPRLSIIFWWEWWGTLMVLMCNVTLNVFYFTLCIIIALEVSVMDATAPLLVHTNIQECTVYHTVTMLCSTLELLQPYCLNITLFCPFHSKGYLLRRKYGWSATCFCSCSCNKYTYQVHHTWKNQQEWGEEGETRHCISPIQPLSKGTNCSAYFLLTCRTTSCHGQSGTLRGFPGRPARLCPRTYVQHFIGTTALNSFKRFCPQFVHIFQHASFSALKKWAYKRTALTYLK